MRFWTLFFIVCLELLSNATRAEESREERVLHTRVAGLETTPVDNRPENFLLDKEANKATDHSLVKKIRQDMLNDQTLTKSAKNVQIIVVGKEITLKGPVASLTDETRLLNIAEKNSGGHTIRNQLEVIRE